MVGRRSLKRLRAGRYDVPPRAMLFATDRGAAKTRAGTVLCRRPTQPSLETATPAATSSPVSNTCTPSSGRRHRDHRHRSRLILGGRGATRRSTSFAVPSPTSSATDARSSVRSDQETRLAGTFFLILPRRARRASDSPAMPTNNMPTNKKPRRSGASLREECPNRSTLVITESGFRIGGRIVTAYRR